MMLPDGWIAPDWPTAPRICAFVTARAGGVSAGSYASFNVGDLTADAPEAVAENKRRLTAMVPVPIRWLRQVHGNRVVRADEVEDRVEADALWTQGPGIACAVKIADCMPVLLANREATRVGAVHAGWRGLSGGVVENTVAAMGTPPERLMAFLGPAIGPAVFEVGSEVREAFCDVDASASEGFSAHRPGKWLADLFLLGRQRLRRCGVTAVYGGGLCTHSRPGQFYSHRRHPATGRMAAVIWLAPEAC